MSTRFESTRFELPPVAPGGSARGAVDETLETPLEGLLDLPAAAGAAPVVVLCHGFKGFAEWNFLPVLADLLVERGCAVVRFNFRGGGIRLGEDRVSELDTFRRHTLTAELADLRQVLESLPGLAPGRLDIGRLGLFGHSRGGAMAVLAAAEGAWRERVRALVTWAAVSTFDRLGEEEKARWRRTGSYVVINARTGQELPMGLEHLDDFERHRERLDVLAAAGRRRAPWLLVHGEADETVPVREADALEAAAAPPVQVLRIAGADHTLNSRHPFSGPNPALVQALDATQTWLLRHLRR
jgi:pimeloyl-ACP methyl ester carboxylesterase